jgi:murein DD-endopeptidase MepM/ murein hydrolase activator NlpD
MQGRLKRAALITATVTLGSGCSGHIPALQKTGSLTKQVTVLERTLPHQIRPASPTVEQPKSARAEEKRVAASSTGGHHWVVKSGRIQRNFSQSAHAAGIPVNHIHRLEALFAEQINFRKDLRQGDHFTVILQPGRDGTLRQGALLAAELEQRGKVVRMIRHTDRRGATRYYSGRGEPLGTDFMRSPLKRSKVSSHFTLRRYHPLLKIYRPHRGTDFKAKQGTPVMATADGVVEKQEYQNGYGNVIFLDHQGGKYTTVYAHLSRFARGVRPGMAIEQGAVIGYVGSSGLSTGPHLHYEFREEGEYRDAMKVALPQKRKVTPDERKHFYQSTTAVRRALLRQQSQRQVAWAQ